MKSPLTLVKIGGNVIDNKEKLAEILLEFAELSGAKVLVHGGGKIASELGEKLGLKTKFVEGRRVTDAETIKLVTMVYGGLINKSIVAQLQALNCLTLGLCGADLDLMKCVKRPAKPIDYGLVGDFETNSVNKEALITLIKSNFALVFSALTHDGNGQLLNTNADTIAAELAKALADEYDVRLIYCFEKKGVLLDVNNNDSVITHMNKAKFLDLKEKGLIFEGMIPKLENAFQSLAAGIAQINITDRIAAKGTTISQN